MYPYLWARQERNWKKEEKLCSCKIIFPRKSTINIIIFMVHTSQQGHVVLTVTNFCINFSEVLLYSVENNTSTDFCTKFLRSTRQLLPKKVENNCEKWLRLSWLMKNVTPNFYVLPRFRLVLEIWYQLDLGTCAKRQQSSSIPLVPCPPPWCPFPGIVLLKLLVAMMSFPGIASIIGRF